MNNYNEVIKYISKYTSISNDEEMSLYFSELKRVIYGTKLTADQICHIIGLLKKMYSYFFDNELNVDIHHDFWSFIEDFFFVKVMDVPNSLLYKVITSVLNTWGHYGIDVLMRTNIDKIGSLQLFILLYISVESPYLKKNWIRSLDRYDSAFSGLDREKLIMLFDFK